MDEIICNCFDNRMLIECSPVLGHMSSLMHSGLVGQTLGPEATLASELGLIKPVATNFI